MLRPVADLPSPWLVENRRRSIAMLPTGAPALNLSCRQPGMTPDEVEQAVHFRYCIFSTRSVSS